MSDEPIFQALDELGTLTESMDPREFAAYVESLPAVERADAYALLARFERWLDTAETILEVREILGQ